MPDPSSRPHNILIVEDDEGYQELARVLLIGYAVTLHSSVEEALADLDRKPFDLILCDINLLGMTGLELISRLKTLGLTDRIPVIMCSSMTDPATRAASAESGAAGFLAKPYDGAALQAMVKTLLPSR